MPAARRPQASTFQDPVRVVIEAAAIAALRSHGLRGACRVVAITPVGAMAATLHDGASHSNASHDATASHAASWAHDGRTLALGAHTPHLPVHGVAGQHRPLIGRIHRGAWGRDATS